MKTSFILCMVAILAFSSCSKSNNNGKDAINDGKIRVLTGIDAQGSKSVATQAVGLVGAQFIKVDLTAQPTDFSSTAAGYVASVGGVAATTGVVTFVPVISYNRDNSNTWFIAYHPVGTLTAEVVTWIIDGQTDVLKTNTPWTAGTYATPLTGTETPMLTFNHQLSQIEVVCVAESASGIGVVRSAWGKIKKIEFLQAPTTMTYALNGLAIANGATLANFSLLKNYDGAAFEAIDMPENNSSAINAVAMLAPVAATATESFKLNITTEGPTTDVSDDISKEVLVNLNNNLTSMLKGNTHKVTLTFKANTKDIEIKSTIIEEWKEGVGGTNEVIKFITVR